MLLFSSNKIGFSIGLHQSIGVIKYSGEQIGIANLVGGAMFEII